MVTVKYQLSPVVFIPRKKKKKSAFVNPKYVCPRGQIEVSCMVCKYKNKMMKMYNHKLMIHYIVTKTLTLVQSANWREMDCYDILSECRICTAFIFGV